MSAAKSPQSKAAMGARPWSRKGISPCAVTKAKAAPVITGTKAPERVLGRAANHHARRGRGREVVFMMGEVSRFAWFDQKKTVLLLGLSSSSDERKHT